jgi:hypothetical protein
MALAQRVHALTGRVISLDTVWIDSDAPVAIAGVDGILFRYTGQKLALIQPCALCGSGRLPSQALTSPADIGYALGAGQPRHPQCQPDDPVNWLDDCVDTREESLL